VRRQSRYRWCSPRAGKSSLQFDSYRPLSGAARLTPDRIVIATSGRQKLWESGPSPALRFRFAPARALTRHQAIAVVLLHNLLDLAAERVASCMTLTIELPPASIRTPIRRCPRVTAMRSSDFHRQSRLSSAFSSWLSWRSRGSSGSAGCSAAGSAHRLSAVAVPEQPLKGYEMPAQPSLSLAQSSTLREQVGQRG
jgi:hypothetical protein